MLIYKRHNYEEKNTASLYTKKKLKKHDKFYLIHRYTYIQLRIAVKHKQKPT